MPDTYTIRNIPNNVHEEIKRAARSNRPALSVNQQYIKALEDWFEARKRGVIR